jgi:CDP-6-deoxy-D-xylo-4-hexulose-3-dehydrase
MTDFAAAMGLVQLTKLEGINKQRRENALHLSVSIAKHEGLLSTLAIGKDVVPGYYGFPIYLKPNSNISRNELCRQLERHGIETRPNMGGCLPDQPGFIGRNHRISGELLNARLIRDNGFFIGIHSELTSDNFLNFDKALHKILTSL